MTSTYVCPCKGCPEDKRYQYCHSKCKDYLDWKDTDSAYKEALHNQKSVEYGLEYMKRRRRRK